MGNVLICQNIPEIEPDLEAGQIAIKSDSYTKAKTINEQAYNRGYDRGYEEGYADCFKINEDYKKQYIDFVNHMDDPEGDNTLFKELIGDYSRLYNRYQEYAYEQNELNYANTAAMATVRSAMIEIIQSIRRLVLTGYTFNKAWLFAYDDELMPHQFMQDFMQRPTN